MSFFFFCRLFTVIFVWDGSGGNSEELVRNWTAITPGQVKSPVAMNALWKERRKKEGAGEMGDGYKSPRCRLWPWMDLVDLIIAVCIFRLTD